MSNPNRVPLQKQKGVSSLVSSANMEQLRRNANAAKAAQYSEAAAAGKFFSEPAATAAGGSAAAGVPVTSFSIESPPKQKTPEEIAAIAARLDEVFGGARRRRRNRRTRRNRSRRNRRTRRHH
jgi:hypothetical protein